MVNHSENNPMGIIAGSGQFPLLIARAAKESGRRVIVTAHIGETWPELKQRRMKLIG